MTEKLSTTKRKTPVGTRCPHPKCRLPSRTLNVIGDKGFCVPQFKEYLEQMRLTQKINSEKIITKEEILAVWSPVDRKIINIAFADKPFSERITELDKYIAEMEIKVYTGMPQIQLGTKHFDSLNRNVVLEACQKINTEQTTPMLTVTKTDVVLEAFNKETTSTEFVATWKR